MDISRRNFFRLSAVAGGTALTTVATPAVARQAREVDPDSLGMLNDSTRCIGCKACQVACKKENKLPMEPTLGEEEKLGRAVYDSPRGLSENTYTLIKMHEDDATGEATFVKRQCMHCADPACASACIVGALKKQKNGAVQYDADMCMGCRYCMVACPYSIPQFEWEKAIPSINKCTLCEKSRLEKGEPTACATACPADAISFGKRNDLLKMAKHRIEADPERYQEKVYGEEEVGGTSVLYLSKKSVDYASLGLPDFDYRPVSGLTESIQHRIFQYFIPPIAVYGILGGIMTYNQRRKELSGKDKGEENEY
jgi:formate dehydrogenase iron-sulfur subunit